MNEVFAILFFIGGLVMTGLAALFYPTNIADTSAIVVQAYVTAKVIPPILAALICFAAAIALGAWEAVSVLRDIRRDMRGQLVAEPTIEFVPAPSRNDNPYQRP